MSKVKPFPSITGSCACNTIRYRLLTSPLFCYACHCGDCQKLTGSAFGLFLNIESYNVSIISPAQPVVLIQEKKPGVVGRSIQCPQCKTELWTNNAWGAAVSDVRVGTLDFPSLMEPDVHSFVESKVEWVRLPEGAKTTPKEYDYKEVWPKSSLKRLEICLARVAQMTKKKQEALAQQLAERQDKKVVSDEANGEETGGEGEKTPTAVEFEDNDGEDDEAFEKRFKETEKALQSRLEKLSLKLEEEEITKKTGELAIGTA
ncbi:Nn.00g003480.m01.CDS01 [Neocucurbitaria sp. VM-36]